MKPELTDQQIENILQAYAMVLELPEDKFVKNLRFWSQHNECGTAFCFGG